MEAKVQERVECFARTVSEDRNEAMNDLNKIVSFILEEMKTYYQEAGIQRLKNQETAGRAMIVAQEMRERNFEEGVLIGERSQRKLMATSILGHEKARKFQHLVNSDVSTAAYQLQGQQWDNAQRKHIKLKRKRPNEVDPGGEAIHEEGDLRGDKPPWK